MAEALNQRKDQKQWDSAAMFSMALAVALFIMTMETEENIKMELAMYDQKRSSTSELDGWEYRNNLHNEFVMASVTQHQGKSYNWIYGVFLSHTKYFLEYHPSTY